MFSSGLSLSDFRQCLLPHLMLAAPCSAWAQAPCIPISGQHLLWCRSLHVCLLRSQHYHAEFAFFLLPHQIPSLENPEDSTVAQFYGCSLPYHSYLVPASHLFISFFQSLFLALLLLVPQTFQGKVPLIKGNFLLSLFSWLSIINGTKYRCRVWHGRLL